MHAVALSFTNMCRPPGPVISAFKHALTTHYFGGGPALQMNLDSLMDGWIGHFGEASQGSTEAQTIGCSKAARNHWYSPKNIRVTNLIWQLLYQTSFKCVVLLCRHT